MPPIKTFKGTRSQPQWLYNLATILLVISGFLLIFLKVDPRGYNSFLANLMGPEKIHWMSFEDACVRAPQLKKPLLLVTYDMSKEHARSAEVELFRDGELSDYVNKNFLPVRVDTARVLDVHSRLAKLLSSNRSSGRFYLMTVPWNMTDMTFNDVVASANPIELGEENIETYEGYSYYNDYDMNYRGPNWARNACKQNFHPVCGDFDTKDEFRQFLVHARDWHTAAPTRGRIHFVAQSKVEEPLAPGGKPRLLCFVQNVGHENEDFRGAAFWNHENSKYINENFEPVLFDIYREKEDYNQADVFADPRFGDFVELRKKLGVRSLPAMVVQFGDGRPDRVIAGSVDPTSIRRSLGDALYPTMQSTTKPLRF